MPCRTAFDILQDARLELGQCGDVARVSDAQILSKINLAYSQLATARPDPTLTKITNIPLVEGAVQSLPPEFSGINAFYDTVYIEPNGTQTKCNSLPKKADEQYLAKFGAWGKCVGKTDSGAADPCAQFKVENFSYERKNGATFIINPAVPKGAKAFISASVTMCPPCVTLDNAKSIEICDYYHILFAGTMAGLLMLDAQDDSVIKKHQLYAAQWSNFVDRDYKMQSRKGSGYYQGAVGTGDEQVVR